MNKEKSLKEWCDENYLNLEEGEDFLTINNIGPFLYIQPKEINIGDEDDDKIEELVFNKEMQLYLSDDEHLLASEAKFYIFEFGNHYYYHPITDDHKITKPKQLRNIGEYQSEFSDIPFINLGVRGEYEICNGGQSYDKWIEKAKFYKHPEMGICEKNSLAGTIGFQMQCDSQGIKPILGETISVRNSETNYEVKLFAKNKEGWRTLLKCNKILNVDNPTDKHILEEDLLSILNQVVVVYGWNFPLKKHKDYLLHIEDPTDLYYQFDSSEYLSNNMDKEHLLQHKDYMDNYSKSIQPVILNDSFYVEKDWAPLKLKLNTIGKIRDRDSNDQWYKAIDHIIDDFNNLFDDEELFFETIVRGAQSTKDIASKCNFKIDLKTLKLPKYKFKIKGLEGQEIFDYYINKGIEEKLGHLSEEEMERYLLRIEEEYNVIEEGGLFDYFTILKDINNFADKNNILRGLGRGSAAGSLIGYLFDLTKVDPMKYDLLFSRFLNGGRIGRKKKDQFIRINDNLSLDFGQECHVIRNKKTIIIKAEEIQSGDDLIRY